MFEQCTDHLCITGILEIRKLDKDTFREVEKVLVKRRDLSHQGNWSIFFEQSTGFSFGDGATSIASQEEGALDGQQ